MKINVNQWRIRSRLAGAVLLAAVAASSAIAQNFPATLLGDGPVAYWPFNGTTPSSPLGMITNSTAAVGTGYVVDNVTLGASGIVGTSALFSNPGSAVGNAGSKIQIPWNAAFNPTPPFSVEFWAKPTTISTDSTGDSPVFSMDPYYFGANRSGYIFYLGAGGWLFRVGGENSYVSSGTETFGASTHGGWDYIVGTFDGTSNLLYVNGVFAEGFKVSAGFKTNSAAPLTIGGTLFYGNLARAGTGLPGAGNRGWDGAVDELAVYNKLLSPATIAAHFSAATTNNSGYHAQIMADGPTGYWGLDDPAFSTPSAGSLPIAVNLGSMGSDGDGTNEFGSMTVAAGPPYPGFPATNKAVFFSGSEGYLGLQTPDAALDGLVGNPITYMAWIKPIALSGWRSIIAQGWDAATGEENYFRIGDTLDWEGLGVANQQYYEVGAFNGGATATAEYPVPAGDVGNWVFLAGTWDGSTWTLYRNAVPVATFEDSVGPVAVAGDPPWSVGSLSQPNLEDGWYFGGTIDEPAIFGRALSGAEIQALYNAAEVAPTITRAVAAPSGPVYLGSSVPFNVWAEGVQPLSFQWLSNGVPVSGATATNFTLANVTTNFDGIYSVVVSNAYGAATSSVALLVTPTLPPVGVTPLAESRWAGFPFSFSASGVGSATVNYQWYLNGFTAGSTLSNITGTAASGTAGSYSVVVNNTLGSATSSVPGVLSVLPVPAGYASTVLGDHPIAYYRLDEGSGTVAHDYAGGFDGTYNGVALNQPGYSAIDSDSAMTVSGQLNSYVGNIAPTAINFSGVTNFTVEAWANGAANQVNGSALVAKGTGNVGNGGIANEQFHLIVDGQYYGFEIRSPANTTANGFKATGTVGPDGTWHHVVGVWDGSQVSIFVDGVQQASVAGPATVRSSTFPVSIGAQRSGNSPDYDLDYAGSIDEVAIYNYALNEAQIQAHYAAAYGPSLRPQIGLQPLSVTNYVGLPVTFSVSAYGTVPLSYQWNKLGVGALGGDTSPSVTLENLQVSDSGTYFVGITNSVGGTSSVPIVLTVLPAPSTAPAIPGLVLHLTFDNTLTDATGRGNNGTNEASGATPVGPSYVSDGELGAAFHYATVTNSTQTNANYVSLGFKPDLQFGTNTDFTVSMWVRLPFGYEGDDLPFFTDVVGSTFGHGYVFAPSFGQNGASAGWGGAWAFSLFDTGALENSTAQGIAVYGDPDRINDGAWHNLVYVFNRKTGETTYVDGVSFLQDPNDILAKPYTQSGTTAAAALDIDTTAAATIGQDPSGLYPEQASADIDDLLVYKRALSPLEASSIYAAATANGLSVAYVPLSLTFAHTSTNTLVLTWNEGTLQTSTNVVGTYTNITASSPLVVTPSAKSKFYRVKF